MTRKIGSRPSKDDERMLRETLGENESAADVIRRALRLLDRDAWLARARADAERLADEDLSDDPDTW